MRQPNLLFIFADQHRKFDIGCYGNTEVKTPCLDHLANEGLRFEHCFSNSPVCVPARGNILTGLYANHHKALLNDMPIDPCCESIAHVLRRQGYHTGYIGKWHLNGVPRDQAIPSNKRLGFEEWKVHNCNHDYLNCYYYDEQDQKHKIDGYEPEIFGALAEGFVRRNAKAQKPWALYLSFATPHDPHHCILSQYRALYESQNMTRRKNTTDKVLYKYNPGWMLNEYFDIDEYWEHAKGYFGHISAIDRQVGTLMKTLESTGQLENTIVLYTSDHGDMLGSQGQMDKQLPYEESVGVPLIAFWKGHIRQGVCNELIGLVDLPVSIAGLLQTNFYTEVDGRDLHRLFLERDACGRDAVYMAEYFPAHNWGQKRGTEWRAVRTVRYTYAVTATGPWLLFDNEKDPFQMNNLVSNPDFAELQQQLQATLNANIKENDELLEGLEFVKKYADHRDFNSTQSYFGKKPQLQD